MPIPSPAFKRKPYQRQATQEIASSLVAIAGVLIQLWQSLGAGRRPSDAQRLAQALTEPGRDQKLAQLASEPLGSIWPSLLGAGLTLTGLVLLLLLKYLRARDQDLKDDQMSNPEGLRGCAHVLYSQLKFALDVRGDDGTLRVTVHRVTEEDSELEQVIDYVGVTRPSGKTRRFSIRSGVIGFAARTGETKLAERTEDSSDEDYIRELVDQWGATPAVKPKRSHWTGKRSSRSRFRVDLERLWGLSWSTVAERVRSTTTASL